MRNTAGWTRALFVALAILHIAPIWSVHYFPTGDGPTHVYNAWVMHGLVTGEAPANIERAYRIDWRPVPNWTSHAAMALLVAVVSPLIAEKIVVSIILALFFAGAWMLTTTVDSRNGIYAFLALPFAYAYTFVGGYYNFTLGVALYLFIVAWWWRHREDATARSIAGLAGLLLLCAFTHAVGTMVACGAIVLLSVLTGRYRQLIALVPPVILLAIHSRGEAAAAGEIYWPIRWDAARILAKAEVIQAFHGWQIHIAVAIATIFAALAIYTLLRARRRRAIALMVVALAIAAVMFWCPAPRPVRDHFTERLSLFVFVTLAVSFAPLERVKRNAFVAVVTLLALVNIAIVLQRVRVLGGDVERLVRSFAPIEAGTSVLPLFYSAPVSASYVNVFPHIFSHVALEKRLADPVNFQPEVGHFPIARRDRTISLSEVVNVPDQVDIAAHAPHFEYVVTRGLPKDAANRADLDHSYTLIAVQDDLKFYRRSRRAPRDEELVLLPLLGMHASQGAPAGVRWRVDQKLRNLGARPIELRFRRCLEDVPCAFVLGPNETRALATSSTGFAFLAAARGEAKLLEVTTVARRVDVERPDLSVFTPAAHERAFTPGGTRIENIETSEKQIGLRVYILSKRRTNEIAVRLRASDTKAVIATRTFEVAKDGMFATADLYSVFGDAHRAARAIDIEVVAAGDARCWAFSTAADKEGRTRVIAAPPAQVPR